MKHLLLVVLQQTHFTLLFGPFCSNLIRTHGNLWPFYREFRLNLGIKSTTWSFLEFTFQPAILAMLKDNISQSIPTRQLLQKKKKMLLNSLAIFVTLLVIAMLSRITFQACLKTNLNFEELSEIQKDDKQLR